MAASCSSWAGASWDAPTSTCILTANQTIPSGDSWNTAPGTTLTVQSGVTLNISGGGALNNSGIVRNEGAIQNGGSLSSFGLVLHVLPGGTYGGGGTFISGGTNAVTGDVSSSGTLLSRFGPPTINVQVRSGDTLRILANASLEVPSGYRLLNAGTIELVADGTLQIESGGRCENSATITNGGTLINGGTLYNKFGGTIGPNGVANVTGGTLHNLGDIAWGGALANDGTIENGDFLGNLNPNATINFGANAVLTNNGTLRNRAIVSSSISSSTVQNHGHIHNAGGTIHFAGIGSPTLFNNSPATVANEGTIFVTRGSIVNRSGATFTNTGTVHLPSTGILDNAGVWNNNGSALIDCTGGRLQNAGEITNQILARIENAGTILSDGPATITNHGTILNKKLGRFDNSGTLTNHGTFTNDHGKLDNWNSFENRGTLSNDGAADLADLDDGHIFNYATLSSLSGANIVNHHVLSNFGTVTTSGTFTNWHQFDNNGGGTLTNPGAVDNRGIVNNFAAATIGTSGSFVNHILNAYCGGTISGVITGNPVTMNCTVADASFNGDNPASCATFGGTFRALNTQAGVHRVCRVQNLVVSGTLRVERGVLEVAGDVDVATSRLDHAGLRILPGGTIDVSTELAAGCGGWIANEGAVNTHDLILDARISLGGAPFFVGGCGLFSAGSLENRGTLTFDGTMSNSSYVYNHGRIVVASGGKLHNSPIHGATSFLLNYDTGTLENHGEVENHVDPDDGGIITSGTIENHGLFHNSPGCPNGDFNRYSCTIEFLGGVFNNRGTLRNSTHGKILGIGTAHIINFPNSLFENHGLAHFTANTIFDAHTDAAILGTTGAIWEFFGNAAVNMFGSFRVLGTASFWSGIGSSIRNFFSTSFHNEGLYVNSGRLDNSNPDAATGGFFENLGTFENAGGVVLNGNGRFANGSAAVPAATFVNTGELNVGTGSVENLGTIETYTNATILGPITGAAPIAINNRPPVATDGELASVLGQPAAISLVALDPDGNPLTYRVVGAGPTLGAVTIAGNQATYQPAPRRVGVDRFVFVANDGSVDSNLAEIVVTIGRNHDAGLAALALSSGRLSPLFLPAVTQYTAIVAETVTSLGVTPTPIDPNASLLMEGLLTVGADLAHPTFELVVGDTPIAIHVTAQDTTTIRTTGLVVTRATDSYFAPTATGSGPAEAYLVGGGGSGATCAFGTSRFVSSAPGAVPPTPPGVTFPHGLFDFTLEGCAAGATIEIRLVYPEILLPGTQYWKYGPTPTNTAPHWYVMPANIQGDTVSFTITDGGLGDDDLTANGRIVDQGGPGIGEGRCLRRFPA